MSFQIDDKKWDDDLMKYSTPISEINMTPFVDVCLVLLIIFMVTSPFAISGVNIKLPSTTAKPITMTSNSMILSITKNGDYFLGKYQVKETQLKEKIKAVLSNEHGSLILFIKADKNLPYAKVMYAMGVAQSAGVQRIGMIGENKRDKK